MHFDGVAQHEGAGAEVVLVSPRDDVLPYSFTLTKLCNNMAKYQTLIVHLQMTTGMGIKDLDVYGDSQLIIKQLLENFGEQKDDLIPYQKHAL